MADREARQRAIREAAEMVRNDRTGFLRRAGDPPPTRGAVDVEQRMVRVIKAAARWAEALRSHPTSEKPLRERDAFVSELRAAITDRGAV
jgi:hypothetical protein